MLDRVAESASDWFLACYFVKGLGTPLASDYLIGHRCLVYFWNRGSFHFRFWKSFEYLVDEDKTSIRVFADRAKHRQDVRSFHRDRSQQIRVRDFSRHALLEGKPRKLDTFPELVMLAPGLSLFYRRLIVQQSARRNMIVGHFLERNVPEVQKEPVIRARKPD